MEPQQRPLTATDFMKMTQESDSHPFNIHGTMPLNVRSDVAVQLAKMLSEQTLAARQFYGILGFMKKEKLKKKLKKRYLEKEQTLQNEILELQEIISEQNNTINILKDPQKLQNQILKLKATISEQNNTIGILRKMEGEQDKKMQDLSITNSNVSKNNNFLYRRYNDLQVSYNDLKIERDNSDVQYKNVKKEKDSLATQIKHLQSKLSSLNNKVSQLNNEHQNAHQLDENVIATLKQELKNKKLKIQSLAQEHRSEMTEAKRIIEELKEQLRKENWNNKFLEYNNKVLTAKVANFENDLLTQEEVKENADQKIQQSQDCETLQGLDQKSYTARYQKQYHVPQNSPEHIRPHTSFTQKHNKGTQCNIAEINLDF